MILISLEQTVPYSEEKMTIEQLLPVSNTTQFAHLQNGKVKDCIYKSCLTLSFSL